MSRQKKIKSVHVEEKQEVNMTDPQNLNSIEAELDKARIELEQTKKEIEEKKSQIKTMPGREVSEDEIIIMKKQVTMSNERVALKAKIDKQKKCDNEMVTGKFINRRAPGNSVKLTYLKYEDDPVKWQTFEDGKVYTIQRGFADQINEHYYRPNFIQKHGEMDPNRPSSAIHAVDTTNKLYSFVPINF